MVRMHLAQPKAKPEDPRSLSRDSSTKCTARVSGATYSTATNSGGCTQAIVDDAVPAREFNPHPKTKQVEYPYPQRRIKTSEPFQAKARKVLRELCAQNEVSHFALGRDDLAKEYLTVQQRKMKAMDGKRSDNIIHFQDPRSSRYAN